MTLGEIIARLEGIVTAPGKAKCRCPVHDDRTASVVISQGDAGVLVHCHAGCALEDILGAKGLKPRDLYEQREHGSIVATYDYRDEHGSLLYQVVRLDPKGFRQRRPDPAGGWNWKLSGVRRVLYRLPELLAAAPGAPVFVVEGEKDADALIALGLTATTNAQGAGKFRQLAKHACDVLAGRTVIVLPDNDDPGRAHARDVERALLGAATVRVLELPGLPPKGDVSDWLAAGGTREDLLALAAGAFAASAPAASAAPPVPGAPADADEEPTRRPLTSRSYHSCVTIISENRKNILGGRKLELNEMTGMPMLDGKPIQDADALRVRFLLEERFEGSSDGKGMKFGPQDVRDALLQVSAARPRHPVREYLQGLHWDGRERICYVPDLVGAARTALNQAIFRRWMISAVARPMQPGCKVDTVLILVGPQGAGKSTFFSQMAGEWFVDTDIDLKNKDAFMVLSEAWILEWSELEPLLRARDSSQVKAFLTSRVDTYRKPWGHFPTRNPRGSVIVGSTNSTQFLTDETGNRRFWPVSIGELVDNQAVLEQRDQLWAEAVALYRAGEQWWLTPEEERPLDAIHEQHTVADEWSSLVLGWALDREPFTVADVLEHALKVPIERWDRGHQNRVGRILRAAGFLSAMPHRGARKWSK